MSCPPFCSHLALAPAMTSPIKSATRFIMKLLPTRTALLARLFVLSACLLIGSSSLVTHAADLWRPIEPSELSMAAPMVERNADAEAILWEVRVAYIQSSSEIA